MPCHSKLQHLRFQLDKYGYGNFPYQANGTPEAQFQNKILVAERIYTEETYLKYASRFALPYLCTPRFQTVSHSW